MGVKLPPRVLHSVDLPAPLAPSNAVIVPAGSLRQTPSSTLTESYPADRAATWSKLPLPLPPLLAAAAPLVPCNPATAAGGPGVTASAAGLASALRA